MIIKIPSTKQQSKSNARNSQKYLMRFAGAALDEINIIIRIEELTIQFRGKRVLASNG